MAFKRNNIRRRKNHHFIRLFAASLLMFSALSYGQETSDNLEHIANQEHSANQEYNANKPILKDDFEWQFALDFSLVYDPIIIDGIEQDDLLDYFMPGLLFDISYKGFFLQTNQRRSNALLGGTEFGYQLVVEDNWQLDLIAKAYMQGYDPAAEIEYGGGDKELLAGLRERNATLGIALRYSRYFDNSLLTLDLAATTSGDDEFDKSVRGVIVDSFYSYLLPYRNWDIYLGTGLTYFSQDIVDYYIGVGSSEINESRAAYTAKGGFRGQIEIYAQYPLSESWSFNAGLTQSIYSNNVKASPLVDTNHVIQVMLGVLYVF
ncbi:MltA-interacting MipA family protein [Colwellia psychrerythraea]|uniref:MltA-interacting MipA family protein n=2 Tax=Colwellia psychrerythraea TaxID=28229 RepID=A0A099KXR0_COLPS|nr:MltA-interacting MipA family protein [Colwellia psychrerythraea]